MIGTDEANTRKTHTMRPKKGDIITIETLALCKLCTGWEQNGKAIDAPEGYHVAYYVNPMGVYNGPDRFGIEPIFRDMTPEELHEYNGPKFSPSIAHFLALANAAEHPNASSGEQIAWQIREHIKELSDDFQMIDREAINGACELIKALAGPWDTDAQKQAAFALLEKGRA